MLPVPRILLVIGFVVMGERLFCEVYKTYIKPDYRPHQVCALCHCTVLKVHGKYYRKDRPHP